MTRLVLHVGLPKTGTTAFQGFAARNRANLAELGVAFCDGFRRRNHVELAIAFSHRITPLTRSFGVHDEADRKALRERLPQMLGDPHRASTVLASSEHVTNLVYRPESVAQAAEVLCGLFDSVTVAVVLRRSDFWTPSMYAESVKSGGAREFDGRFVLRHRRLLDHVKLLERWGSAFGPENVVVVPFLERDKADPAAIPMRLLALTGIDLQTVGTWPRPARPQNTTMGAYAIELLRRLNAEHPDSPIRRREGRFRILAMVRQEWPGPPPAITPEAEDRLSAHNWISSDIDGATSTDACLWQEWLEQPGAEPRPTPTVSDEDLRRLVNLIGQLPPPGTKTPPGRAGGSARRLAGRVMRTIARS